MNLRAILFWKILIGISLVIILWWSWDPAYSNYDKYNAEVKKEKKAKKGLGDKEEEQIQTLEKMYQEKRDNKFIIAAINGRIHKISIKNSNRSEIPFEADISLNIKPVIHHNKIA